MNRDQAYKVLYDQTSGKCNHSPEVITILKDIIRGNSFHYNLNQCPCLSLKSNIIDSIDRWNLYEPDQIHIVFTVKIDDAHMITFKSAQVICNLTEFTNRWRSNKLNELIDEN